MAFETFTDGTPTNGANPWIDSLVVGGKWADADGGTVTINVAFKDGLDPFGQISGGVAWQPSEVVALALAATAWEAVANVDFVAVDPASADIWYWLAGNAGLPGSNGRHEIPGFSTGEPLYGVFNFQGEGWSSSGLAPGGFGFVTLIHELGHGLGLAHPHDGGPAIDDTLFPGVSSPSGDYGDHGLNQGIWTTMSYNDGWPSQFPGHADYSYGWQSTPMALDIAAIQSIYGANTTHAAGSDTYVLPNANGPGTSWACIWDVGGIDTISAATSSGPAAINLNAAPLVGPHAGGFVSSVAGVVGGFTIANGVVIENATGGSGNDWLVGNSARNTLAGGTGLDTLQGNAGNDYIDGGSGSDAAAYGGAWINYRIALAGPFLSVADTRGDAFDGTDTLTDIEFLQFANGTFDTWQAQDDAPTSLWLGGTYIAEGAAGGTLIGTLDSTDADILLGDTATYSLVNNAGGRFSISGQSLVVANSDLLDFESDKTHMVTVRVTDAKGLTCDESFAIGVMDQNDVAPVFSSGSFASISENSPFNTLVYDANAVDGDASPYPGFISYSLTGPDAGRFWIDILSGEVRSAAPLDFEAPTDTNADNQYDIVVHAKDGVNDTIQSVAITVTDQNDVVVSSAPTVGSDTIRGTIGNDVIAGGFGNDMLTGGLGKDAFLFNTQLNKTSNVDHVTDFKHQTDKIWLDHTVFRALDRGKLDADAFFSGKGVNAGADNEDRVVYDTRSGALYYDKDGLGGAKAIKFAILDGSPDNLGSSDFLVVA